MGFDAACYMIILKAAAQPLRVGRRTETPRRIGAVLLMALWCGLKNTELRVVISQSEGQVAQYGDES